MKFLILVQVNKSMKDVEQSSIVGSKGAKEQILLLKNGKAMQNYKPVVFKKCSNLKLKDTANS